jgi:hypothetical protein
MKPTYMDGKTEARIGDVVRVNTMRGIVIAVNGTTVKVLGIGTDRTSGDTFVLPQRHVEELPASGCHYLEKQVLNAF